MSLPAVPIDNYLPYMPDVTRCETSLRELNLMWRLIESTARMVCPQEAQAILPTIAATRAGFDRLERELVRSLVAEKIDHAMAALGTRAGYVIDIVVRNLYERTADVGFLATDRVLCEFVAGLTRDVDAVRARLLSYRRKYTVYDEILLLDPQGNVLVQTDPAHAVEGTQDPLLEQALASDGYVQIFRPTDLRPGLGASLIYAQRMLHPTTRQPAGVLCLVFGFEAEMAGIFRSHGDPAGRSILLLLDAQARVIASSDEHWIGRGARVPVNPDGAPRLLLHAGREYLVCTRRAEGYQGYLGPEGWQGQVMVPVDLAFTRDEGSALEALDPGTAAGLLSHARSFSPPLYEVIRATESIRRVVWNGQVVTAGRDIDRQRLKTILDQISETGARSNTLFAQSVRDLYDTVLASGLQRVGFVAHLAVDLLDRNLYERADDCRWWAMTPELRTILAQPEPQDGARETITPLLRYIHSLYTVYTRLFVYDRGGRIVAQSHDGGDDGLVGRRVDEATLQAVLALQDEQRYHVSPFQVEPWTDGRPTYTYHAAIRHPEDGHVVGGIGIVFHAERELLAMLRGAVGQRPDARAYLTDRQGRVIASTDPATPVGTVLAAAGPWLELPNGATASRVIEHEGHYVLLGASASAGYREFKTSDGYRDHVLAFVIETLGPVRRASARVGGAHDDGWTHGAARGGQEYATFYLGNDLLALDAACVREAVPAERMTSAPADGHPARVGLLPPTDNTAVRHFLWVYDLGRLLGVAAPADTAVQGRQIILVEHGGQTAGLLVDELHAVPEFAPNEIIEAPFGGAARRLIDRLIRARGGEVLIPVVDTVRLFAALRQGEERLASAA
ncbi:chemotaxis protein CheW [Tepidimonas fonticaldi]|uniref:Chemotaxis protein CheW n=1 Tax=Tepidimonas fonticaldi TaxID=1101373 RepID=A0A1A6DZ75_9BURK|nr:chemotaxis protein CheW [Tepidimonas fonticaldi]OBS31976.1 chemotaxis protein CheW [Tepidimonas fonticaldi]